jgi:hypothetical protein
MSSPNLASSARKLEDLPSDGGHVVDTLAGAILEEAQARLGRRIAALEGPQSPRARAEQPITSEEAAPPPLPPAPPKRGRGRPPGSPNRKGKGLKNGHDVEART